MDNVKTPKTKEQKIEILKQQLADREKKAGEYRDKLQAKIDSIAGRGTTEDRKNDTRRKILLGAMLQNRLEKRKLSQQKMTDWMSKFLVRDDDRALFQLAKIDKIASSEIDNPDLHESGIAIDDSYLQLSDDIDNHN
jgi:large subunit ribosomal protein L7/L12